MDKQALIELQEQMAEYAKYLEECTYHPFNKIREFSNQLLKILIEDENN